jgi:hypothetical protein
LERPFEKDEVFEVVKTLNCDKASRPDVYCGFLPSLLGGAQSTHYKCFP